MSVDMAFRQLRDANPVTNPAALREHRQDSAAFLESTQQRSRRMQTQDRPLIVQPPPPRKRWLVPALAGAAAVIVAIAMVAALASGGSDDEPDSGTTPQTTPQTTVTKPPTTLPTVIPTVAGQGVLTMSLRAGQSFLPFFDSTTDPVAGFDIDLVSEIARRASFTVRPLLRAGLGDEELDSVANGDRADVHVAGMPITEQREQLVDFTIPYYVSQVALLVNTELTPEIGSVADLADSDGVIGVDVVTDTWIIENLVPIGIELAVLDSPGGRDANKSIFEALEDGHLTALVIYDWFGPEAVAAHPSLEIVEVIELDIPFGIAVDPSNPELLAALNEALQSMIDDGTYQAIYDRWFEDPGGSVAN